MSAASLTAAISRSLHRLAICLLVACLVAPARAQTLFLQLPSGLTGGAELLPGQPGLPAVLLVHGFLQTREFYTVKRLADALADSGYTVLSPTLSLGIDRRRRSLPCEALHTHSMSQGNEEILAWTEWLAESTDGPIVAIGHSSGSIRVLAQAAGGRHPALVGLILISPSPFGPGPSVQEKPHHVLRARRALEHGHTEPIPLALSFCRRYTSLPEAYLSYLQWDRAQILRSLESLHDLPVYAIIGSADVRFDAEWTRQLALRGVHARVIEGANHFFDAAHEFELADEVESALTSIGRAFAP